MSKPALRAGDLGHIKARAAEFGREHPGLDPAKLAWGERLCSREARDAYSMATLTGDVIDIVRNLGGRPCLRCGQWTTSWCEACPMPSPSALCTACDKAKLLCFNCSSEGKIWSEAHAAPAEDKMQISGFHDESGEFHTLEPPLEIPTGEVPLRDGVMDLAWLSARIEEYQKNLRQQPGASTGSSSWRSTDGIGGTQPQVFGWHPADHWLGAFAGDRVVYEKGLALLIAAWTLWNLVASTSCLWFPIFQWLLHFFVKTLLMFLWSCPQSRMHQLWVVTLSWTCALVYT